MPTGETRVTHLRHERRDQFVTVLEQVLPQAGARLDVLAHYLILCAFWGLIAYVVMRTMAGLP